MENGTLVIEGVQTEHNGKYECSTTSDSIIYELLVQGKILIVYKSKFI